MHARATRTWGPTGYLAAGCVVLSSAVMGCDGSASGGSSTQLEVVASTSAWGSVAAAIGGSDIDVVSIISDADQDPHSFEASARTLLAVKEADLIIENGAGYDDFMESMISSAATSAPVLNAVTISGHTGSEAAPLNEHVWYDIPTARRMALKIADELSGLEPDKAATFDANAATFVRGLDGLLRGERAVAATSTGTGVGITEPVPLYMLQAMGLQNLTPAAFSEGVEEGSEVSARTLDETLGLYRRHEVAALIYNEQTTGAVTEQVKQAAEDAGIPVVAVTETLPPGLTYLSWMRRNLDAIRQALTR